MQDDLNKKREELAAKKRESRAGKKTAERIRNLWLNANTGNRMKWQTIEQSALDFFLNSQLTEEEANALADAGMPDFVVNRMTPILETMKYFVTAGNPRWKAVGTEGSDTDIAKIHSDVIDYCWYISSGRSVFS